MSRESSDLLRALGAVSFELDLSNFSLRFVSQVGSWLGYPADSFLEPYFFLRVLALDDRGPAVSAMRTALIDGLPRDQVVRAEHAMEGRRDLWLRFGRSDSSRHAYGIAVEGPPSWLQGSARQPRVGGISLQPVLEQSPVTVFTVDRLGAFTSIEGDRSTLFGVPRAQLIGRQAEEALRAHPWFLPQLRRANEGESFAALGSSEGASWLVNYSPMLGDGGGQAGVLGLAIDVSERERASRRLLALEAVIHALAEARSLVDCARTVAREVCRTLGWKFGAVWRLDERTQRLTCAGSWRASGFFSDAAVCSDDASFAIGEGLPGRVWKEAKTVWIADLAGDSADADPGTAQADHSSALAVPIWCGDTVCGVVCFVAGEVHALDAQLLWLVEAVGMQLGQFSECLHAQQLQNESDVRRRMVLETSLESIIVTDEAGRIVEFNPAAERLFGHRREEALGHAFDELIVPPRLRDSVRAQLRHPFETSELRGRCSEQLAVRRDGTEFPIELLAVPLALDGTRELVTYIRDLTERYRANSELLYQKCLLEAQNEASPDGMLVVDEYGQVLSYNKRFLEVWGLSEDVIERRSDRDALREVLPRVSDPERFLDRVAWLYAHPEARGLDEIVLNDGRTLERYTSPVRSLDGQYFGRVWFFHDVTARKRVEQRERLITREQTARVVAEEAQRRMAFLANASNVLSATLDYEALLQLAAHVPLSELADWVVLDIIEDAGPRRAAVVHADPAMEARLRDLREQPVPGRGLGIPQVLRDRLPLLFTEVDPKNLAEGPLGELPEAVASAVRAVGVRSSMVVPVLLREEVLGALTLVSMREGMRYSAGDLQLATDLAHRIAVAIDHARIYQEAQRSIRARDEFLSVASHELRTPLTSLQLAVQSAVRHFKPGVTTPEQLERLQRALVTAGKQSQRLTRLIDALLDASRAQAGRLQLELSQVDLSALAREVVGVYMEDLVAAGCEVTLSATEPVVGLWDRSRLEQVITNLLTNAMKYGAGKPIEIEVGRRGPLAVLVVKDHGIGIDEVKKERIFERFVRAVSGPRFAGLGLGLYIVRRIVDASGGAIEVESEVGKGSTFRVLIPTQGPPVEGASPAELSPVMH